MQNHFSENKRVYRILISIIFGLIGFLINMFPIKIYEYQGNDVTLLIGLIFPLFITIIWGWKYGLLSALVGGCQSMWFLWRGEGYGMLYSVPIYTLWIVWHGVFSNYRRKIKLTKWYLNVYVVELAFRCFSEFGFIVLFRFILSCNPPFWDQTINLLAVPSRWVIITVIKHIVFAVLLLLIVKLVIQNKKIRQWFEIENANIAGQSIIVVSFFVGLLLITLETLGSTYFIDNNILSFAENLFTFTPKQIFTRCIMFFTCIFSGIIFMNFYNRIQNKNIILKEEQKKINDILQLTASIGVASSNDQEMFLFDLLSTSLNIIWEAEYGFTFIFEEETAIIVDVIGHDERMKNHEIEFHNDNIKKDDIIKVKKSKKVFSLKTEKKEKGIVSNYLKPTKESIIMILSIDGKKIAGIVLDIPAGKSVCFSDESIKMAKILRNIPIAFYTQLYSYQEKQDVFKAIVTSIIKILNLHNPYTEKHSTNVAKIASGIALKMRMDESEIETVYWTGLVHDIGKILIPDNILNKESKLTDEEYEIIKKHTIWGYQTLNENKGQWEIAEYVLYHHESWDGKGYPEGLSGEKIPLVSRILAVADTYDAMTSNRSYRRALDKEIAIKEITSKAGTQFDPIVAKTFVENADEILLRIEE